MADGVQIIGHFESLSLNKFPSTPSMRKGYDGEKKTGKKNNDEKVATNIVASRPPERRPTATSTAGAKICEQKM